MKKTLELLGVNSSGFDDIKKDDKECPQDDAVIYYKAIKILNLKKREEYLRNLLKDNPPGFINSKILLVHLIKKSDPKFACELAFSVCRRQPIDSSNYLLYAEVAITNKAWRIAKSAIEASKWLLEKDDKKINKYFKIVSNAISKGSEDTSDNDFWKGKEFDKCWVLEVLYNKGKIRDVIKYSFKLIDVYPQNPKSYSVAYRGLSLVSDRSVFADFIELLRKKLNFDQGLQNLYLGISYYSLNDIENSNRYLLKVLEVDKENQTALFYMALNFLLANKIDEFVSVCEKITPNLEPSFTSLYFIYSALSDCNIEQNEFPNQKNISQGVSIIIKKLSNVGQIELVDFLLKQFIKLNFHIILPDLNLYLAEQFIKINQLNKAKNLIGLINDPEVHRLYAWIYRLEGHKELAEKELAEYRLLSKVTDRGGFICQVVDLGLPKEIQKDVDKNMQFLKDVYDRIKNIIDEMDLEYGMDPMTCVETGCQDCCKKTFPFITYIEYIYLRKWLDTQSEELRKQIQENSRDIVEKYKKRFGRNPIFIVTSRQTTEIPKEYPSDFVFDCPNLGDNKCNVYEARPFTCRVYSYSTGDGIRYKGCNYFYEQLKFATKLSNIRKIIGVEQFVEFAKEVDKSLIGDSVVAPIPIWFAQSHEETQFMVRYANISNGIFAPFYWILVRLYKKKLKRKQKQEVDCKQHK